MFGDPVAVRRGPNAALGGRGIEQALPAVRRMRGRCFGGHCHLWLLGLSVFRRLSDLRTQRAGRSVTTITTCAQKIGK